MSFVVFCGLMFVPFCAAWGLTGVWMRLALRWGIVSPVTDRSSHVVPTPRLGGAGLAMGFGVGTAWVLASFLVMLCFDPSSARVPWVERVNDAFSFLNLTTTAWLAAGWALMFLVGLADDLWDLPPLAKLAGEALAALAPVAGAGLLLASAGGSGSTGLTALVGVAAAFVWILFFANAYNFMDGMDGFAGGFALEASWAMFATVLIGSWLPGATGGLTAEALFMPVLAMACSGFLAWNNPPAKVFMGDGGSLSVGYLLAVWPLLGVGGRLGAPLPWVTSMTILMPFTFDVALTLVRRLRRGENVTKAHREHLYQRLMRTGMTHAEVLALAKRRFHACAALAVAGALLASRPARWLCLILALAVMLHYWRMTLRRERENQAHGKAL